MIKKPLNILFKNPKRIINRLDLDEKCRPQNLDPLIFYKITKEFETETD